MDKPISLRLWQGQKCNSEYDLDKVFLGKDFSTLKLRQLFILREIPDKNQKILNGAGHSWSQISMKLSEYVTVVTLSKYSNLFFPNMHGCHGNQTQRF